MEEMNSVSSKKVVSNFLWRFLERFGAYIISFVISVVLARLLEPSTYGTVALMTVVITFLDVFVTGGFSNSLIHNKNATEKDFNTILIFNLLFSLILYIALFFAAPLFANYYGKPILKWLIRLSGVSLLISGIKSLQYAYVARRLEFKKFFFSTVGGTIASGIVGVTLAILGFGPWALVIQGVLNHLIDCVILAFTIKWKPKFEFDFKLFKIHFSFGWKILVYKIIYNISTNLRQLVIGKRYSDEDLAFFDKGKAYPNIIGQNITSSLNSVMYPVLSKTQDNKEEFNKVLKKTLKMVIFVILPMMIGFFCVGDTFIYLLLGAKWIDCVPYLKIFCVVVFLNCIESVLSNGPLALGKSTASMVLGIVECAIDIVLLIIAIPHGVRFIAYSMVISSFVNCTIYFIYLKVLTGFSFLNLLNESANSIVASLMMGFSVYPLLQLTLPYYVIFIIQIVLGILIYYFLNKFFKNDMLDQTIDLFKKMLKRKEEK